MARSYRQTTSGESIDTRYFMTFLTAVNLAAKVMCSHWSVENNLHVRGGGRFFMRISVESGKTAVYKI